MSVFLGVLGVENGTPGFRDGEEEHGEEATVDNELDVEYPVSSSVRALSLVVVCRPTIARRVRVLWRQRQGPK